MRTLTYDPAHPELFLDLFQASPLGQDAQFELLARLIQEDGLGQGDTFDFVCMIVGAAARLGYDVGGASPLMREMALHLDRQLEYLLKHLKDGPGENSFNLVLAGAHGAPPAPTDETRARMAVEGESVAQTVDKALQAHGLGRVTRYLYPFLYLDTSGFRDPEPVRLAAGRAALEHPAVAGFYTAGGYCSTTDGWRERYRNSFHQHRSGDVMLSYLPEYVEDYGAGPGDLVRVALQLRCARPALLLRTAVPGGGFRISRAQRGRGADPGARHGGGADFLLGRTRPGRGLRRMTPELGTTLCGIALRNPVLAASGTFAYGVEFEKLVDLNALGGFVVKGLSREPIEGNPPPRVYESEGGMINSIGLQNIGVRAFVRDKLPALARLRTAVFANVFGYQVEDYVEVVRVLNDHEGLAGYELNVSCPNTCHGGIYFSSDPALLSEVVEAAKRVATRPVIVKLSPNVSAIEPLARAAEASGADAISLVNTLIGLAIDARTRRPRIGAGFGGLSGPAIKPVALRLVYQAAQAVKIPVVGLGGIASGEDAAEFLIAGASAVQVGTATFWDPRSPLRIARRTLHVSAAGEDRAGRRSGGHAENVSGG